MERTHSGANGTPPTIVCRSASARYVRGMSAAIGCRNSGMNAMGKKMPDRNIIGNWTTLVMPFAASSVRANEAMT